MDTHGGGGSPPNPDNNGLPTVIKISLNEIIVP